MYIKIAQSKQGEIHSSGIHISGICLLEAINFVITYRNIHLKHSGLLHFCSSILESVNPLIHFSQQVKDFGPDP